MKQKLLHLLSCLTVLFVAGYSPGAIAQTTVTLSPTAYGTVTGSGTQTANSLSGITTATPQRGWFKFDLSALSGATISSANLVYTTASTTINSGSTFNELNALSVDPTSLSGTTLYNQLAAGVTNTTNLFTGAWSGTHPLTLQTNGPNGGSTTTATALLTYLTNQVSAGYAAFGLVRGSTNVYDFQIPQLTITYTGGVACSGQPTPGTANASSLSPCPSQTVTISRTGGSSGSGLTFQLQSRPAGVGAFTNQGTSQGGSSFSAGTVTTAKDFRIVVTCTNSSMSDTTAFVTVTPSSFLNCYCASAASFSGDEEITNVTFGTLNNTSSCASLVGTQGTATGTA